MEISGVRELSYYTDDDDDGDDDDNDLVNIIAFKREMPLFYIRKS